MTAPESLLEAVRSGSKVTALRAQRDDLGARLSACTSDRDAAALHARLADVLDKIEAAEKDAPETKGTALDELASRRKADGRPDASSRVGALRRSK